MYICYYQYKNRVMSSFIYIGNYYVILSSMNNEITKACNECEWLIPGTE